MVALVNTRRNGMRHALLALTFGAFFAGCDDSPKEKCEKLIDTYCETVATCADDADLLDRDYTRGDLLTDCKDTVAEGAHCSDAEDVSDDYDRCLAASSDKLDCDESNDSLLNDQTFAIPAICEGVVQY
jgi:hypothetical protein